MNKFTLITCLVFIVGAALANPSVRESRHAVPVGMIDGLVLVDDDANDGAIPTVISTRSTEASPLVSDQQTEQQRFPGFGYGYGYGRPWGHGYGRPWGHGYGRPWGPGYGRPWGPYGRPWGPYFPYRPWGPY